MNKVELLAPAGELEKAKLAIDFNANALYLGSKIYSLRARADNFDVKELKTIIDYAHSHKAKVYVVTNILCHNSMIKDLKKHLDLIMSCKPDGFIVADPFIIHTIHKYYPKVEIHVSTQQSATNSKACLFWKKQGATRLVTAREVDFKNLAAMCKKLKGIMEIEYFIHGALCVGYSGRCMMSNHLALRDANVGGCAQSCRWNWELRDQKGKLISDKFTMSTKDICHVANLGKLIDAGIASFKIEGRMKSLHYIATVVNAYRHAIDDYYHNKLSQTRIKMYEKELAKAANRATSFAWFKGYPTNKQMLYHDKPRKLSQNFAFIISKKLENNVYEIISKNFFTCKNKFEAFGRTHDLVNIKITQIKDAYSNEIVNKVNRPMYKYLIKTNTSKLCLGDIGRIIK